MINIIELIIKFVFLFFLIFLLIIPVIIISLMIKLESEGPAIHWSKRVGKKNKIFYMPKFRTMKLNTPNLATHLLENRDDFVTKVGKFLRKTSLDEIPQIYSILVGNMNFIGPRPALYNQKDLINLRKKFGIDQFKPGITGWAQVNGRDKLSIDEKVKLEKEYNEINSFKIKLNILYKSMIAVISQKNIS